MCFTWSEPYPRLIITRDRPRPGGGIEDTYYGPFVDPGQLKATVALVRRVLPLRERRRPLYKDKPCLNYDIGVCPGACQKLISEDEYADRVQLAEMVFRGQGEQLLATLGQRMQLASQAEEFERAGEFKEQMELVRGGLLGSALHFSSLGDVAMASAGRGGGFEPFDAGEDGDDDNRGVLSGDEGGGSGRKRRGRGRKGKQPTAAAGGMIGRLGVRRTDFVAVGLAGDLACFQVFRVRGGRLIGRLGFTYRVEEEGLTRGEVLQACLERYWGDALASRGSFPSSVRRGQGSRPRAFAPPATSFSSGLLPQSERRAQTMGGIKGSGEYFVDVPDEVVTADALPEGGAALLSELLSEAKDAEKAQEEENLISAAAPGQYSDIVGDGAEAGISGGDGSTEKSVKRGSRGKKVGGGSRGGEANSYGMGSSPSATAAVAIVRIAHDEGKGERHHLCVMVTKNAELEAKRLLQGSENTTEGLSQLARMLGLPSPPARIEGFDVSHTGGGQAVASAVSFVGGKADKKGHRRYRIKTPHVRKGHSDDYASLREVITRRFAPPSRDDSDSGGGARGSVVPADSILLPDLVVIDGGKGQLAAALEGACDAAAEWRRSYGNGHDDSGSDDNKVDIDVFATEVSRGDGGRSDSNYGEEAIAAASESQREGGIDVRGGDGRRSATPHAHDAGLVNGDGLFAAVEAGEQEPMFAVDDDPDLVLLRETPPGYDSGAGPGGVAFASSLTSSSAMDAATATKASTMVDVGRGRRVAFVSLAKKQEEVFVPGDASPLAAAVEAGPSSPGVMVLRQVRGYS